jgi:chromosome segregation ATPase
MTRWEVTFRVLALLILLAAVAGCDRSGRERDKAAEEAARARAELQETQAFLERTESEKEELSQVLADISEDRKKTESELTALKQAYGELQSRLGQAVKERDAAMGQARSAQATVENLRNQLKEKEVEVHELEEWVKELQTAVAGQNGV